MDEKRGFRVVTNPEGAVRDVLIFPGEDWSTADADRLLQNATAEPGALLYELPDYPQLVTFLDNTETVKDIEDVRICAGGRGFMRYAHKPGGGLPPEDALVRAMGSAPALPRPGASVTVRQDLDHPEGYVVREGAPDAALVDRFIDAYTALGGTLERLVERLERMAKR